MRLITIMSKFVGNSIKVWMEIDGQEYDILSIFISGNDRISSTSFPNAIVRVCVGMDLTDPSRVQPNSQDMQKFYEYPVADIKMQVDGIESLELFPSLKEGVYNIFRGDISQVSSEKEVTWGEENTVTVTLLLTHLVRRLTMGDVSQYPFYNYQLASWDNVLNETTGAITGRHVWGTEDIASLKQFLLKVLSWRASGDENFIQKFAIVTDVTLGTGDVIENIESNDKNRLNEYLKTVIEEAIAIDLDFDALSITTQASCLETIFKSVGTALRSAETTMLDIIWFILRKFYGFISYTSIGALIRTIPAVDPVENRIKLSLDDYTSCEFSRSIDEPISKFIAGGTVTRDLTPASIEGVAHNFLQQYSLPDQLRKGGVFVHYVAPSWLGTNVVVNSGSEETEDVGLASARQGIKRETKPVVKDELDRYLCYSVVRRRLSGQEITIVTPLRMDITQGTVLEVEVPVGVNDTEVYCGVVEGVGFSIDSETEIAVSQYHITGVEKKQLYDILENDGKHPFKSSPSRSTAWAEPEN